MTRTRIIAGQVVPLSPAENAARDAEEAAWAAGQADRDAEAVRDQRRLEYPSAAAQRDALILAVLALEAGQPIPAAARAVLLEVGAVKDRYPLPVRA